MSIVARVERDPHRALLGFIVAFVVALPALGQPGDDEHWVATWATALVARPLPPAAPPTAPAPCGIGACGSAAPTAAAAPTRRTACGAGSRRAAPPPSAGDGEQPDAAADRPPDVGGDRVRVVLSNVFGTAPLVIGAAASRCASKAPRSERPPSAADRSAAAHERIDPARRHHRQRSRRSAGRAGSRTSSSISICRAIRQRAARRSPCTPARTRRATSPRPAITSALRALPVADDDRRRGSCWRASRWPRRAGRGAIVAFGDSITDGVALDAEREQPLAGPRSRGGSPSGATAEARRAERGHQRQPACCATTPGLNALARFDRDVLIADRCHARHRAGRHQRHRHRARESAADRRRSDRRAPPADRAGARARPEDLRRDADAVRGRRLLHARRRSQARRRSTTGFAPSRSTTASSTSTP